MNDYTPSISEIRTAWVRAQVERENALGRYVEGSDVAMFHAELDRAFAEVERAAAEKAWDECARAQLEYEQSVRREWPWNPYRKETR